MTAVATIIHLKAPSLFYMLQFLQYPQSAARRQRVNLEPFPLLTLLYKGRYGPPKF